MSKICCHPDCKTEIGRGHVTCLDHWKQLSEEKRREIQKRLHGWQDGEMAARAYAAEIFKRKGDL